MTNFNFLKISKTKRIRYLKLHNKNATYIVFLHGFMSDLEGQKPSSFYNFAKKNTIQINFYFLSIYLYSKRKFEIGLGLFIANSPFSPVAYLKVKIGYALPPFF